MHIKKKIKPLFLSTGYGYKNLFPFYAYRLLPFIVEIQNTMDWMFVDTSLCIGKWFMLNTVYSQIFIQKCWRMIEDEYRVPRGAKKPRWLKYFMGGFFLLFLVLAMWFPMLFVHVVAVSILKILVCFCEILFGLVGVFKQRQIFLVHKSKFLDEMVKI